MTSQADSAVPTLTLAVTAGEGDFPGFASLLGKGVGLCVQVGVSIRELLCGQLGLPPAYLEQRLQTIFLDGQPVDDLDSTRVTAGATLALSAALPGLAGATLRRGGGFAPLRKTITHDSDRGCASAGAGMITLKLFNMTARELGPLLLQRGVQVTGTDLAACLRKLPEGFWKRCPHAVFNATEIPTGRLLKMSWPEGALLLRITGAG